MSRSRSRRRLRREREMVACEFTVTRRGSVAFGKPCSYRVLKSRERAMDRHVAEDHREQVAQIRAAAVRKLTGEAIVESGEDDDRMETARRLAAMAGRGVRGPQDRPSSFYTTGT